MYYYEKDVWFLINRTPYIQLSKPELGLRLLKKQAKTLQLYSDLLQNYPVECYEKLDFFYTCLQNVGALDCSLLDDLMTNYTWRGIITGAWLVALSPQPEYKVYLIDNLLGSLTDQWIIKLSLGQLMIVVLKV